MKRVWCLAVVCILACRDEPTDRAAWKPPAATIDRRIAELGPADRDRELRLTGTVAAPIEVNRRGAARTIAFSLVEGKATIRVVATGILPDRFREHVTASVFGRWDGEQLDAHDVFVAAPELPGLPRSPSP